MKAEVGRQEAGGSRAEGHVGDGDSTLPCTEPPFSGGLKPLFPSVTGFYA